jgi:hypothetical protein
VSLQVELAIGIAVALVCVLAVAPRYVRAFIAAEWRKLLLLALSVAVVAAGIWGAGHLHPAWRRAVVTIVLVAGELWFVLRDPKWRGWLAFLSVEQWRAIDAETVREPTDAGRTSWRVLFVLVTVAVSLTLQEYIGDRGFYEHHFPPKHLDKYWELRGFAWWAGWRVLGYIVIPLVALVAMREPIGEYHISPRGFFHHLWIYAVLFLCIAPAVIAASTTESFRQTYPFYRMANRSRFDLWSWEALYAAQFLALECFFRGFILAGLRRALGANAIFVMIVPYCMIHFGKPLPETLGAIGAGIILGTLAMRTRSIWGGVLIHVGVAISMDVLALRGCPPIGSPRGCN